MIYFYSNQSIHPTRIHAGRAENHVNECVCQLKPNGGKKKKPCGISRLKRFVTMDCWTNVHTFQSAAHKMCVSAVGVRPLINFKISSPLRRSLAYASFEWNEHKIQHIQFQFAAPQEILTTCTTNDDNNNQNQNKKWIENTHMACCVFVCIHDHSFAFRELSNFNLLKNSFQWATHTHTHTFGACAIHASIQRFNDVRAATCS